MTVTATSGVTMTSYWLLPPRMVSHKCRAWGLNWFAPAMLSRVGTLFLSSGTGWPLRNTFTRYGFVKKTVVMMDSVGSLLQKLKRERSGMVMVDIVSWL